MVSRLPTWGGFVASLAIHGALAILVLTIDVTPREEPEPVPISLLDKEKPPPPPPEPEVEPEPPKPEPPPEVKPPPAPIKKVRRKPKKKPKPPSAVPPPPPPKGAPPAYGIKLENTVTAAPGTGIAVPSGDTLATEPAPATKPTGKKPGEKDGTGDGEYRTAPRARIQVMPKLVADSVAGYPEEARHLGLQGRVVLELIVDEKGRVIRRRVLKSLHPRLDEAAMTAAKKLRFEPGTVDGDPVRVKIPYTYVFVLE